VSNVTIDGVEYAPVRPVGGEVRIVCGSPMWWAAFLLTLVLIGAVSWTWAGEVER